MIAMLAALEEEISGLKKKMSVTSSLAHQGCLVWEGRLLGKEVLLAKTGVGRKRAQAAAAFLVNSYKLEAAVSFGFAAGVSPELKAGDVVVCSAVYRGDSQSKEACFSDARLLGYALRAVKQQSVRVLKGDGVTVFRMLATREDKMAAAAAFSAAVADMESYWVGQAAAEKGIPFLAARAVSDAVGDTIPHLELFIDASGSWDKKKAALYFLAHPREAGRLAKLCIDSRRAQQSLNRFMEGFLTGLGR